MMYYYHCMQTAASMTAGILGGPLSGRLESTGWEHKSRAVSASLHHRAQSHVSRNTLSSYHLSEPLPSTVRCTIPSNIRSKVQLHVRPRPMRSDRKTLDPK